MDIIFDDNGLVPVITQDIMTNDILMLAYANEEAIGRTIETGLAHYYSRSRKKLWLKGETSGNFQEIKDILIDCDSDTIIYRVVQKGPACHTGSRTCFYTSILYPEREPVKGYGASILNEVFDVITDRKTNPKEGSYTNYLFDKGIDKILKKVGEETAETIVAAKNNVPAEIALEVSDLIYHLMVMLAERGMTLDDIYKELRNRR